MNPRFAEIVEAHFGQDVKCITACQEGGRSLKAAELLLQSMNFTVVVAAPLDRWSRAT
jgi:rhodanese-related sulfurtransferase